MRNAVAIGLAAVIATAAGLVVLYLGLTDAAPPVFFGTEEERESLDEGRRTMWIGAVVLGIAAVLLAAGGRALRATLVAAPAVVTLALVYAFPDASYAWLAFVPLALIAFVVALTSLARR
jgi:hypothetical protein